MFTQAQINKIIDSWGEDIYKKILHEVEIYSKKWKLSNLHFHESYSMNAILFCDSETYGDCVLKIGGNSQDLEFVHEYNILREYKGRRYAKIYESDINTKVGKKVMLIEGISPGTPLKDETSLDKRLAAFSELFNGLHIKPNNTALYKRYIDGVMDHVNKLSKRANSTDLYRHMLKAKDIFLSISPDYPQEMLLHGDLQYHNNLPKKP